MTPGWTHLHVHSHYSFLDGASAPEVLARRAADLGQDTLALTDWSGLYGAVVFDRACRAVGVRPLHGAEIALTDGRHLTLLVKDTTGWRSLCRLLTAAQLAGHKGHAPVAPEILAAHTAGLICLTGCRHGALATPLLAADEVMAWRTARWLRDLYGDDLWVELPRNEHPDDRPLTHRLARLAARLGVGIVATANVHYATPLEGPLADVLACIKAGTTLEAARHLRANHAYALADAGELLARFVDLPAAVTNTAVVAARCTFTLDFGRHVFPAISVPPRPDGTTPTPDDHLRALCRAGLTDRYAASDPALWRRALAQLDHELAVIAQLGLAAYFLVVHDVVRFARERGIPAQGRGSAASSVAAYTLGISRVEPLTHRLLFERFLSAERGSLPDIEGVRASQAVLC
jgi:DNA polymerase III alpha subunit